jgi:hypothetical protein
MNALTLLKEDHDLLKDLLEEASSTTQRSTKKRVERLAKIKDELMAHEIVEEEIIYPAIDIRSDERDLVLEAYEEHNVVDRIMKDLENVPVEDELWLAKFTVMKENILHHIREEEGKLFKVARDVFDRDELEDLGVAVMERKEQVHSTK